MSRCAQVVMFLVLGAAQLAHAEVDPDSFSRRMVYLGVTPRTLALVGCSVSQVRTVATQLGEQGDLFTTWNGAEAEVARLSAELRPLLDAARARPFDSEARSAYTIKRRELAGARLRLASAQEAVFGIIAANLSEEQVTDLRRCRSRMHTDTPAELWVVDCSDAEWRKIQLALTAERRAARRAEVLSSEHADVLAAAREQPRVREAARLLEFNQDALQQALDDGLAGGG